MKLNSYLDVVTQQEIIDEKVRIIKIYVSLITFKMHREKSKVANRSF